MAVTFVSTITQWGINSSTPATSGSFTPTAGNQLVVFAIESGTGGGIPTVSGTGTYTQIGTNFATTLGPEQATNYWNSSCSGAAQTITVTRGGGGGVGDSEDGWAWQYSGAVTASSFVGTDNTTPGTGTGAIVGSSVTVPSGAILLALCADVTSGLGTITSPSGTSRGSGTSTVGSTIGGWRVTEYAGTGAAIQPSFTDAVRGAADSYFVIQVILAPAAVGQPPDADTDSTWDELWGPYIETPISTGYNQNSIPAPYQDQPEFDPFFQDPTDVEWFEAEWDLFGTLVPTVPQPYVIEDVWPWHEHDVDPEWLEAEWDLFGTLVASVAIPARQYQDEWDPFWFEEESDESWWQHLDDQSIVNPTGTPAPYVIEDVFPWHEVDADPDFTDPEWDLYEPQPFQAAVAGNPIEDVWPWHEHDVDPEWVDHDWDLFGTLVASVAVPANAYQEEWDWWVEEESDESWWQHLQDEQTVQAVAVAAQPPDDVYPWDEEEPDDTWWHGYDDAVLEQAAAASVIEDAWDWTVEELEDQTWWHGFDAPLSANAPPPQPAPTVDLTPRPSRRNVRFKWGFPKELPPAPITAPASTPAKQRYVAEPSKLLRGLLKRAEGIPGPEQYRPIAPAPDLKKLAKEAREAIDVSRETIRQRKESLPRSLKRIKQTAVGRVEKGRERLLELETRLSRYGLEHQELRRRREGRLTLVEKGAKARIQKIHEATVTVMQRLSVIEGKMEEANQQLEKIDALHKGLMRAAASGTTRSIARYVEEVRLAEEELARMYADLVHLEAGMHSALGHDEELVAAEQERRAELARIEEQMQISHSNLVAVQYAVSLFLGNRQVDTEDEDSE